MNKLIQFLPLILLLAFVIYRRIQRTIGFQPLVRRRLFVRMSIMSVFGLLALGFGILHPIAYVGDAVGTAAGFMLAYASIRYLSFEQREGRWYYRTHVWVEAVVLVLFIGRLVFDILSSIRSGGHRQSMSQITDPVTGGALLMFACYYVVFAVALLRKERSLSGTTD